MQEKTSLATHEINLGVNPCNIIKRIYFRDVPWIDCYKKVATKFTQLKQAIRKLAPMLSELEILQLINKFSEEDVVDHLENKN